MAQSITLGWNERAPITVGLAYEDGTVVDLDRNWSWVADPTGVAIPVGNPGAYFIEAQAVGATVITFTSGEFSEIVEVTVTGPLAVGLAVSIGPAEPKP